ncbi:biliverdin-producing heme oxygenase [Ramlibacter sp. AW1]|uniref:Biliverdin-producing heme oxygenase n=1 Tax=Ramlibacter aurantiacus TaxID=2801330 RepID=A0A936ZKE0_9BURK|nr:biliverdin-producing heme oxygenase [Ramlibacter aurantiacus]MBL0421813.1 biliverdin-producing heme oxygenase [Ramlibacter aurantiacus]
MTTETTVLPALRQATAAAHLEIESVMRLDRLDSPASLAAALQVFESFLSACEPMIGRALPPGMREWFEHHRRAGWAAQDLDALHTSPLPRDAMADLAIGSAAQALGSLYVLEGSALGGRVIARHLRDAIGVTEANGGRYFGGRGEHTGAVWREFCALLDRHIADEPAAREQACAAAIDTFKALTRRLRDRLATAPAASAG